MLIFQLAKLAQEDQPITTGNYSVPVRVSDDGDCLSTFCLPRTTATECRDAIVSVQVSSAASPLPLDEPGRVISLTMDDMQSVRSRDSLNGTSLASGDAPVAKLSLLRYDPVGVSTNAGIWIIQRELRHRGFDICFDGSSVLIGGVEKTGNNGDEIPGVNLVSRLDMLTDRDGSIIDREKLKEKTVLIVGLGSVGSVIACDLARSGIGKFVIADHERLEWGNVVRHAAGLSDVGRLKSRIVADLIKDRNPRAEVSEISSELASESKEIYDRAVASADVVICATDNRASRLICNRLSIKHQKKIVFGGLSSGAYAGMVFQCQAPETMCYHCFVTSFPEAAADRETNESEYSGGPDGHLALDIAPVTNLMAKLALIELQRQSGMVVAGGLDMDLAAPWYLWINRREGEYSELPPLGSPVKGPQVFQWHAVRMDKLEDCPHCGATQTPSGSTPLR